MTGVGGAAYEREVTAPRRILSTETAGRALAVVDELLEHAATTGERAGNLVRLVVSGLGAVLWTWFKRAEIATSPADVIISAVATVTFLLALWFVRRMRRPATRRLVIGSALLDAALISTIIVSVFVFRTPDYPGAPRIAGSYLFLLAIYGTSLRLSRRAVVVSAASHGVVLAGVFVADITRVDAAPSWPTDWFIVWLLWMGASLLGYANAVRTRRMVLASATQTLQAERSRQLLGAYVSEEVAEAAFAADDLRLGGEQADVAVLFSDLRSFTSYSESLAPDELVRQLNRYLSVMVEAIQSHGGVVDKYIGDAIMAVFGAPTSRPDDAARAIRAAQTMRLALAAHNRDRENRGLPPLRQGIGVHFGPVVAGNVGTPERASYTVIGDTVNTASRLESATKEQGVEILVSEDARAAAVAAPGDLSLPKLEPAGDLKLRGREQPVAVFTLAA